MRWSGYLFKKFKIILWDVPDLINHGSREAKFNIYEMDVYLEI
jgi:hypothetical protein